MVFSRRDFFMGAGAITAGRCRFFAQPGFFGRGCPSRIIQSSADPMAPREPTAGLGSTSHGGAEWWTLPWRMKTVSVKEFHLVG